MNSYHDNDTNNKIKMAIVCKGHKIICQLRTLARWDFPHDFHSCFDSVCETCRHLPIHTYTTESFYLVVCPKSYD